jgi:hypothetical protein
VTFIKERQHSAPPVYKHKLYSADCWHKSYNDSTFVKNIRALSADAVRQPLSEGQVLLAVSECGLLSHVTYRVVQQVAESHLSDYMVLHACVPAEFNLWSWFLCLICDRATGRPAERLLADEVELLSGLGLPLGSVTRRELGGLSDPEEQWCKPW